MQFIRQLFASKPDMKDQPPQFFPQPDEPSTQMIAAMNAGTVKPWRVDAAGRQWLQRVPSIHGVPRDDAQ